MAIANFVSNKQIEEEEKKKASESIPSGEQVITGLSGEIRRRWEQAKRAKVTIEQAFLKAKRQRDGQYEPQKLAAIKSVFGADYTPVYMMLTETKCRAAEGWIKDVMLRPDEEPWDLEPTPIPDIPEELEKYITALLFQQTLQMATQQYEAMGIAVDMNQVVAEVKAAIPQMKERLAKEIKKKAKEAANKMKEKIADQFAEGGWVDALEECIFDIVTYGICFLKGPTMKKELVRKRTLDKQSGQWANNFEDQIISKWERRSPFDVYPAPDAKGIEDGYIFDKISLTPQDLSSFIGVPGYDDETIRVCLREYRTGGLREWTAIDTEKARLEGRESMAVYESEKIDCLHYMGSAQGQMLLDWGMSEEEIPDPDLEYPVSAWMVGTHIIRAMINPDPLGKKNLSKACFNDDPDSFWGRGGVPSMIEDVQNICNAVARAIVNNVAIGSGPQVEVDKDRVPGPVYQITPWKVWLATDNQMKTGKAINFYMPPLVVDKLMNCYDFFMKLADEDSGIPRYAHGESDVGGAGKTASGLSMLMTHAARGVKMFIRNIDKGVVRPTIEKQFYHNLDYEEIDFNMIGDMKVVAKGSTSLIAKEQQAVRRTEFLDRTANPLDSQIIGVKGRQYLLEETAKSLEIDTDKLFEEFEFEKDSLQRVANPQMGGAPEENPMALNPAGDKVAGQDFALFQGAGR